ncbi:MAG TPA: CsgG/HfaB family protein [Vicinamibacterales bacterium]|jgi:curli biogenesis system outer membrane secretion channel CsgG|nr:CsgG/HfaB family protein [Vicinamibacterales bacterium]
MTVRRFGKVAAACLGAAALASPVLAQNKDAIEKCAAPIGTMSINEPEASMVRALSGYNLGSPSGVLRILVQESNCFLIVERGSGLRQMQQERALAQNGQLQQASNVGEGQMVAADFLLTPGVIFSDQNAGGVGGAAGGILGHRLGVAGGGVKFKEAQTSLLVADMRSGVQVAASEGKAKKTDFALGGIGVLGVGLAGGGYTSTDEGKIIAASFRDNYNNVVRSIRSNPALLARAQAPKSGAVFNEGDVLRAKINGVQIVKSPKDGSAIVVTLHQHEEVVFLGKEEDGYLKVLAPAGEGWVRKLVVIK